MPVRGEKVTPVARPAKTNDEVRFCEEPDCGVRLSRFNVDEPPRCWLHRPVKYGRVRGVPPDKQ